MQVTEITNEGLKRAYKVVVAASVIEQKLDKMLQELSKSMKLPGFRPGKVPLNVVKQKHGKGALGDVLQDVVSENTDNLLKERNLRPALQPKIEITSYEENKDLEYTATFEIFPDVPQVDWEAIQLERWQAEATDKEVEEGLERIRSSNKDFVPAEAKHKAVQGDTVVMDFVGKVAGEAFAGGTAESFRVEIGSGSLIPGFEDQLVGLKAGDEKVVKVTFPENYGSKELAGKAAEFDVKVQEIQEAKLPELNDEFAKKLGFESLEKLRDAVKGQIQKDYDGLATSKLKKELFDVLDKQYQFAIPESMIELEFGSLWRQMEESLKQGKDTSGKSEQEMKDELRTMAERRVRLGIILAETGKRENVSIAENDLRQAIFAQALRFPGQEQAVIEYYRKNRHAMEELRGPILEDKVVELVLGKAKVKETNVAIDKLTSYFSDDEESEAA